MAEEKNMLTFGYLKENEIQKALNKNLIDKWSVIYTSDTKRQFLINETLEIVPIKAKVPVFLSEEIATTNLNLDSSTYEGELVSVYNNNQFKAYVVGKNNNTYTISPVYSEENVDYDKLQHQPIKNMSGSILEPINLKTVDDGIYKINYFISPSTDTTITSYSGNIFFIETKDSIRKIKRISNEKIYEYTITNDEVKTSTYITDQYLTDNKYQTEEAINSKLQAYDALIQTKIEEYVNNTVKALISQIVSEELDTRYAQNSDIELLF